jgi:hypothetical protein
VDPARLATPVNVTDATALSRASERAASTVAAAPCLYARGMHCDAISRWERADTEATGMVYSSRPGCAPRGCPTFAVTAARPAGETTAFEGPPSGVSRPTCSCMVERLTWRRVWIDGGDLRFSGF